MQREPGLTSRDNGARSRFRLQHHGLGVVGRRAHGGSNRARLVVNPVVPELLARRSLFQGLESSSNGMFAGFRETCRTRRFPAGGYNAASFLSHLNPSTPLPSELCGGRVAAALGRPSEGVTWNEYTVLAESYPRYS